MTKIFVGIPTVDAYIHAAIIENLWPQIEGSPICFIKGVSPVAHARNLIVKNFLASDATHLLMVDADTIPPKDGVRVLLNLDRDIASGLTPIIREDRITSNVYVGKTGVPLPLDDKELKGNNLVHVDGVGAAFILIKRAVIEKIGEPVFAEVWGQDGSHVSEDIFFCNAAKDAGFDIIVAPYVRCKHSRTVLI